MSKNVTKKSKDAIFLTSFLSENIFFEFNNFTEGLFRVIFKVIYVIFYSTIIYFHCFIFLLLFKVILLILK